MHQFNPLHNPEASPHVPRGAAEIDLCLPGHMFTVGIGRIATGFQFEGRGDPVPQLEFLPQFRGTVGMQIDKPGTNN